MSRSCLLLALAACFHTGCQTTTTTTSEYQFPEAEGDSILDSRLQSLEDEVARYPKRHDLHYEIAGVMFQKEDYHGAEQALMQAIEINPNDSKYHYHLGRVYLRSGELQGAEDQFRRSAALVSKDRYTGPHAALGYVLARRERYHEAVEQFKKCVEIEPANPSFYYFLGSVYDILGEREATIHNLQEYLTRGGITYRTKVTFLLEKMGVEVVELPPVDETEPRIDESPIPADGAGI